MAEETRRPTDDELLDLLAGRGSADLTARIAQAAEQDPDLRTELALMRSLRSALAEQTAEPAPGDLGWARLSRAIEAEAPRQRRGAPVWRVAAVAAVGAVAAWQFVALPLIPGLRGTEPGYVTATDRPAGAVTATVAFVPDATEGRIRALLAETGAQIVGGPTALGLWRLGFADDAARAGAIARLAAEPDLVESVQAD
jgi:hypothetical protein